MLHCVSADIFQQAICARQSFSKTQPIETHKNSKMAFLFVYRHNKAHNVMQHDSSQSHAIHTNQYLPRRYGACVHSCLCSPSLGVL